jgi:hypothetical protein
MFPNHPELPAMQPNVGIGEKRREITPQNWNFFCGGFVSPFWVTRKMNRLMISLAKGVCLRENFGFNDDRG